MHLHLAPFSPTHSENVMFYQWENIERKWGKYHVGYVARESESIRVESDGVKAKAQHTIVNTLEICAIRKRMYLKQVLGT